MLTIPFWLKIMAKVLSVPPAKKTRITKVTVALIKFHDIKYMDVRSYVFNIVTFLDTQEMDSSSEVADTSIPPGCPRTSKNGKGKCTIFRNCYLIPPVPQGLVFSFRRCVTIDP